MKYDWLIMAIPGWGFGLLAAVFYHLGLSLWHPLMWQCLGVFVVWGIWVPITEIRDAGI